MWMDYEWDIRMWGAKALMVPECRTAGLKKAFIKHQCSILRAVVTEAVHPELSGSIQNHQTSHQAIHSKTFSLSKDFRVIYEMPLHGGHYRYGFIITDAIILVIYISHYHPVL